MQLTITLTEEQEKALLTQYKSIGEYVRRIVTDRADRLIEQIVSDYADNLVGVTTTEQATIDDALGGKIIVKAEKLPDEVKKIIVRRAPTKTMVEKLEEQALMDK